MTSPIIPMNEICLDGLAASGGFAAGSLVLLPNIDSVVRGPQSSILAAESLHVAIETSISWLKRLADRTIGDGADILAFQIAMLEDSALSQAAFDAIEVGESAEQAWKAALDREIEGYDTAADEYFRTRAGDLRDIRDRVLATLLGAPMDIGAPAGAILIGHDLKPSFFLATDWSRGGGIALTGGSRSSHVAILARAQGVPMIVGIPLDLGRAAGVREAMIDGDRARLYLDPSETTRAALLAHAREWEQMKRVADAFRMRAAETRDGTPVAVHINVAHMADITDLDVRSCDGIGLVRTEFLMEEPRMFSDEEAQYRNYRDLVEWAAGRPVTIRTFDIGADKPVEGLTIDQETNPFLGMRGIRLSLFKPDHFVTQLRALCRAAVHGSIEIMLPMVALASELDAARVYLDAVCDALRDEGIEHRRPKFGNDGGGSVCCYRSRTVRRGVFLDWVQRSDTVCHGCCTG